MPVEDLLLSLLALGVFFYGIRLLIKRPESELFFFDVEAMGQTHRFHFPKNLPSETRIHLDDFLEIIRDKRGVITDSSDEKEIEEAFRQLRDALRIIADIIPIDRRKVLELLRKLDEEIEVRRMHEHLLDRPDY